jgi:hypothetical protein
VKPTGRDEHDADLVGHAILDRLVYNVSGSTCRSTARGKPVQNRPRRVDRTKPSVSQVTSPKAPHPGWHHLGMPGAIKSECPGGFVGIGKPQY